MKFLLWCLVLFGLAVAVALALHYNTGYAVIVFPPADLRVDISLNALLVFLVLGFLVIYGAIRLTLATFRLPAEVRSLRQRRQQQRAQSALLAAQRAYFEGRFGQAEKLAQQALDAGAPTGIAALIAARSAHKTHGSDRRDGFLALLADESDHAIATQVTHIEFLLDEQKNDEALQRLAELQHDAPKLAYALRLELTAQLRLGHQQRAQALIELLQKRGALTFEEAGHLQQTLLPAPANGDSSTDNRG